MTEAARTLADRIQACIDRKIYDVGLSGDEKRMIVAALTRPPLPGTREEVARDREALTPGQVSTDFHAYWDAHQKCPEHSLITENAANATWHAAYAKYALPPAPMPEPVAWRWRPGPGTTWIYDPDPQWLEDHRHEIEAQALYAAPMPEREGMREARCPVCDWPMAKSQEHGCVPGDCSYRPDDPVEQRRIKERRAALALHDDKSQISD